MESVKVAILGAGTGGLAALREVRRHTEDFVIINGGAYGTTCARVGCMPSKALIEAANLFHSRRRFAAMAIAGSEQLSVDLPAVLRRVRRLRDDFVAGVLQVTDSLGDRNVRGHAMLVDPHTVEVDGRRFRAESIVVATGSTPILPEAWRPFRDRVLTTDDLFEQVSLPRRLAVVGLGGVGAETAQALARLGVEVTGFDALEHPAGLTDPWVAEAAGAALAEDLPIHLGEEALVEDCNGTLRVTAGDTSVTVDAVVAALGRRPNVATLGLENLGVELGDDGLPPVDPETMRIGDLPVYIAGDVTGDRPLLHEAADEGHIAGYNAVRGTHECFQRRVPLAIFFTAPNVALVGATHRELAEADVLVGERDLEGQGRLRMAEVDRGRIRIYAEKDSGRLLGAELCAPAGEHLAHHLALAMQSRMTLDELLRAPFYHPVAEEGLRSALRNAAAGLSRREGPDLSQCPELVASALP